jgi:hypothetical protein
VSFYEDVTIGEAYDAIVFVETSTPTHPTPSALVNAARGEGL